MKGVLIITTCYKVPGFGSGKDVTSKVTVVKVDDCSIKPDHEVKLEIGKARGTGGTLVSAVLVRDDLTTEIVEKEDFRASSL